MSLTNPIRGARRPVQKASEEGYILLGVLILLALFVIAMAVAMPKIAYDIQRDRDVETMRRGKQYVRAIQLYYRKFNAYPPNLDALVKTNEIRFLRKKYVDPTTGKDDWKPVMFGQNKTPLAMGFFGQPLAGTGGAVLAGTGPMGGGGAQSGSIFGGSGSSPTDGTTGGGGLFNNPPSPTNPTSPTSPTSPTAGGGDASGGASTGTTDANGNPTTGNNGPILGGGMVGVMPASPKKSILVFKKKDHYNEWEFTYSQMMDMQTMGGGNTGQIGQPMGGQPGVGGPGVGGPGVGGPGVGGPGVGGPGIGGPGGVGGNPPIPPPPTFPPQQ